ncbi:MAG: hypothetical protein M1812_006824 [Candelaria pacifica]|nr:MAG: hypothetical protein M1812_006824 [Candelaria pacifica]
MSTTASRLIKREPACSTFYGAPAKDRCLEALSRIPDNPISRPEEITFVPRTTIFTEGLPLIWQSVNFGDPSSGSCIISLRFASREELLEEIETWRNIRSIVLQILDKCVGVPVTGAPLGTGGGESCGQNGRMYIAIYAIQSGVFKHPNGIPLSNARTFRDMAVAGSSSGVSGSPQWPEACVEDPTCSSGNCDLHPIQNALMYGASTLELDVIGTCLSSTVSRRDSHGVVE